MATILHRRQGHLQWQAVVASSILLILLPQLQAADWPQWQGLNRDGVWAETGIMETFPGADLPILWRAKVGPGWSSPVIAQGKVYVADADWQDPKACERILCFEETTGKLLWTQAQVVAYPKEVFAPGSENGPASTPIVQDGKVYTLGRLGDAFCLDAATGAVQWHRDLRKEYQMKEFSNSASPLIEGDLLILVIGGKPDAAVLALSKTTGKEVWHALDEEPNHSSPIIVNAAGKRQLIVWSPQAVTALNPLTGAVFWRERLLTTAYNVVATPISDGKSLFAGGVMYNLHTDKPGASERWRDKDAVSNTSSPLLLNGYIYTSLSNGAFVALDATTGKQVWKTDKVATKGSGAAAHLTVNGASVLIFNDRGEVIRARLKANGYEEISRAFLLAPLQPFGGRKVNWTPAAYANGKVFARNNHELVCASLEAHTKMEESRR